METIEALPLATEGYPKWRLGVTLISAFSSNLNKKKRKWINGQKDFLLIIIELLNFLNSARNQQARDNYTRAKLIKRALR